VFPVLYLCGLKYNVGFFSVLLVVGLSTLVSKERVKERQPSRGGEGSNPRVGSSCRQSELSGRREKEKRPSHGGEGSNHRSCWVQI
jgi:hypothetical protein